MLCEIAQFIGEIALIAAAAIAIIAFVVVLYNMFVEGANR